MHQVPSSTLTALLTDKEALTAVLLRHVLPETIFQKVIRIMISVEWDDHNDDDDAYVSKVLPETIFQKVKSAMITLMIMIFVELG